MTRFDSGKEKAMKTSCWLMRQVARCLIILLALPFGWNRVVGAQETSSGTAVQANAPESQVRQGSPNQTERSGTSGTLSAEALPDAPEAQNAQESSSQNGAESQSSGETT